MENTYGKNILAGFNLGEINNADISNFGHYEYQHV